MQGAGSDGAVKGVELVIPNPKLKLMDQVREVMRLKHYALRTETCYGDWIRRFVRYHGMKSREDLSPGTAKIEEFLSDLAVNGHVAASTRIKRSAPFCFSTVCPVPGSGCPLFSHAYWPP